jgi:phosphoenolpyruvate carboxylase
MSRTLTPCTPALLELAARSIDDSPHRIDEPYRRALTGVYSRLAATLKGLTDTQALRHAIAPSEPYPDAGAYLADLVTIRDSLQANHGGALIRFRLARLRASRFWISSRNHRPATEFRPHDPC